MTVVDNELGASKIGIFCRGGSGKSTVATLLARALQNRGNAVCILDADSTNIGLAEALGVRRPPLPLLNYFGGSVFQGGPVTCPVDDPTPLENAHIDVTQLPQDYAGRSPDGVTLMSIGRITDQGPGAGCDGPHTKIVRDCRVYRDGRPLLTLVDFKAGLEDTARGALASLDWALVIVDPTRPAIKVAMDLQKLIAQIHAGVPPATVHLDTRELVATAERLYRHARIKGVLGILNKMGDLQTETTVRARLRVEGIAVLGVVTEHPQIARAWLEGTPLEPQGMDSELETVAEALEQAWTTGHYPNVEVHPAQGTT
jgi:CO dehydrogenase maturation factor